MTEVMFEKFYDSKKVKFFMCLLYFLYVFFFFVLPDLSKMFLTFFLLLSLPMFYFKFNIFKFDPFFCFFLFAILVQIFSWCSSVIYFSEISNTFPKIDRLSKLFSFLFLSYWLHGCKRSVYLLLIFYVLAFILATVISDSFQKDFLRAFNGFRVDFDFKNAQFTSMLSGFSIIVIGFLILNSLTIYFRMKKIVLLMYSILLLFSFFVLVASQSRQVWLAIMIILIISPFLICFFYKKAPISNVIILFVFFLGGAAFLINTDIVKNRISHQTLTKESEIIEAVISGKLDEIPSKKNGIRINSWIESFYWIIENPLVGSGPNSIGEVINQSKKFSNQQKKRIKHLHSFHIEILVAYGILGSLVIYGMYYWLIRSLVLAHRENPELKMYTVLGICFLIFWVIINFFESFSSRSYGVYVHNIMFGCLYTFYFTQQRKKIEEAEACA